MSYRALLYIFVLLISLFRVLYIIYSPFDLSPDEAHYWEWSRRLDLSYYSKGPGVAYIIALFTTLLGDTEIGVRFGAVLFAALTTVALFFFTKELTGSQRQALASAVILNIVPLFFAGSILMTTDILLVFFWTLSLYGLKKLLVDGRRRWWYLIGLATGIGFLCKYTMILFYGCLFLLLLATGRLKEEAKRKEPYIALLVTFTLTLPVVIWNIRNDFVSFRHVAGLTHVERGFTISLEHLFEFLGSQFAILTPLLFTGILYAFWVCAKRALKGRDIRASIIFWMSFPILLLFILKSLQAKVQANWAVLAYIGGLTGLVWVFAERMGRRVWQAVAALSVLVAMALSLLLFFPFMLDDRMEAKLMRAAIYKRTYGWNELGRKISELKEELEKEGPLFIVSDRYQIASELAFYVKGHPRTYNLYTGGRRLNQYDLWEGFYTLEGYNAIHVRSGDVDMEPAFRKAFQSCRRELFTVRWKSTPVKRFSIFICRGFKGFTPPPVGARY